MLLGLIVMVLAKLRLASYYANKISFINNDLFTRLLNEHLIFLGLALGIPVMLIVCQVPVYHEPIVWGYASACWAVYFLLKILDESCVPTPKHYFGFSIASAIAFLARVSFALPFFLAAAFLGIGLIKNIWTNSKSRTLYIKFLGVLAIPIIISGSFQMWYNYDRYGNYFEFWTKERWVQYQGWQKVILDEHGPYNIARIPYTLLNYYGLRLNYLSGDAPFVQVPLADLPTHTSLFNAPDEITSLSLLSTWLVLGGVLGGFWILFAAKGILLRLILIGFLSQQFLILIYFAVTHRYLLDLVPLHLFCAGILFSHIREQRYYRYFFAVIAPLIVLSIALNITATLSYLSFGRTNLPDHTRLALQQILEN